MATVMTRCDAPRPDASLAHPRIVFSAPDRNLESRCAVANGIEPIDFCGSACLDRVGADEGRLDQPLHEAFDGKSGAANLKVTPEPCVRNQNYSVPVTLAIRRSDTIAISSVPWM
jgi:hypothetical protein